MVKRSGYVFCLFSFCVFISSCRSAKSQFDQVCRQDVCYRVELALTEQEFAQGLQFREHMEEQSGMLFIFPETGRHAFWMKDTKIPLDILWMNPSQEIVHIEQHVSPCQTRECPSFKPKAISQYVLEINAGQVEKHGIQLGERIDFQLSTLESP